LANGGFSPHDIHDAPVTQEAVSIPGAAIAATLSDSPVAQSQAPNLNQEKSDQGRLDPATASVRNDSQSEMIQAWALFLPPLVRVIGRQTARICCKYNGYAVRLDYP